MIDYNKLEINRVTANIWLIIIYYNKLEINRVTANIVVLRKQGPSACFPNITNKHLYIDNKPISRVGDTEQEKSFKFLGIYMDETLTWKHRIRKVCSRYLIPTT